MTDRQAIWAILPVKALDGAKQRLAGVFSPQFRRQLAAAMLTDVLAALAATSDLTGILVVTIDPDAKRLAEGFGARISSEGATSGQTAAVESAIRTLMAEKVGGVLTIPGDVPGVTSAELETLLRGHAPAPSLSIVPAHDRRGSNAIMCSPADIIPLQFGNDSFLPHLDTAHRLGIEPNIVVLERLGLDIDNPEDLFAFAGKAWPTKTTEFLQNAGFPSAL